MLLIVSGSQTGDVLLWSGQTRRVVSTLYHSSIIKSDSHECSVLKVKFIGEYLLSQFRDGFIKLYDISRMKEICQINTFSFSFCQIDSSIYNDQILCVSSGKEHTDIYLWDLQTLECISQFHPKYEWGMVMTLSLSVIGGNYWVVAGYEAGVAAMIDMSSNTIVEFIKVTEQPILDIAIDSALKGAVISTAGDHIFIMSMCFDQKTLNLKGEIPLQHDGVGTVDIRGDDKIFATGGWDHRVRVFSYKKLKPLVILRNHSETITHVCFCDSYLGSSSQDGRISLYQLYPS